MLVRLATRTSPKIIATALGIALCVMFLSGAYFLLDGLRDSTSRVSERFDEGPILAYSSLPLEEGRVQQAIMDNLTGPYCAIRVVPVTISFSGTLLQETYAVSVSNASILSTNLAGLGEGEIWVSNSLIASAQEANITIPQRATLNLTSGAIRINVTYERVHPDTLLPNEWAFVNTSTLLSLDPSLDNAATFLLVNEDSEDLRFLSSSGFTTMTTVAAIDFFRQGVYGLEPSLWGLALAAGAIIIVLTFTLMALEVRYRAKELRTLRQIGASPGFVLRLVLFQSLYVSALGTALGLALGSIFTNAIVSFAPVIGMSTFTLPTPSLSGLAIPAIAALLSGLVGGIVPALHASRMLNRGVRPRS